MTTIQSVNRALSILDLFSFARPSLSLTEISQELKLAKGTTHNLIKTLESKGFLNQDPETRRYRLGSHLLALGTIMAGNLDINRMASGPIRRLADKTDLICRVAIWDSDAALVTLNAISQYTDSQALRIGPRVDAYCSSIGRVLLAFAEPGVSKAYLDQLQPVAHTSQTVVDKGELAAELAATRQRGYAIHSQQVSLGRASIAAPIRGRGGEVVAAVSLTGSPDRIMDREKERLVAELLTVADEISNRLGHRPGMADTARSRREDR
jgi:DNA-binding IclR family transcriptional regulator